MSILMRLAAAGHLVGSSLAAAPRRVVVGQRRTLVTTAKAASVSKADLIKEVAEKGTLTPKQAQAAVNILLETIVTNVSEGKKVTIPGFGTFEQRLRAARKGRNPKTGEALDIPQTKSPAFSAGKTFKDAVKGISK